MNPARIWNDTAKRLRRWLWRQSWALPEDPEETRALLRSLHKAGALGDDVHAVLDRVFNISRLRAADIMIPRIEMQVFEEHTSRDEVVAKIAECGHSRYPVIGGNLGSVEGILLAKDVLTQRGETRREFSIKELMLPAHTFPESRRLNLLLSDFQKNRIHMGIVINEYGEAAGLVTIEDVLEEIVGEIVDEHDPEEQLPAIRAIGEGHHLLEATVPVADFNEHFKATLDSSSHATIGGLILKQLGYLPDEEEIVPIDGFRFKVVEVRHRRIRQLEVFQESSAA